MVFLLNVGRDDAGVSVPSPPTPSSVYGTAEMRGLSPDLSFQIFQVCHLRSCQQCDEDAVVAADSLNALRQVPHCYSISPAYPCQ
jgi:hypothetical protein